MEQDSALQLVEHRALWFYDNLATAIWTLPSPASPEVCVHLGRKRGDRPESTVSLNWLTPSTFQYKNTKKKTESPQFTIALVSLSTEKVLGGIMVSGDLNLYFIYFMLRPVESKNSLEWRIKQQSGIAYSVSKAHLGLLEGLVWRTLKIAVTQCNVFISFNWTALVPGD